MKLALAIICSFVLAGTPFLLAQTPSPACARQPVCACCRHGGQMPCCQAKSSSGSQSLPAVPAQTGSQNQLSLLAANVVAWILPDAPAAHFSSAVSISFATKASPLYARNCVRLI
jgi:hypothetical protein